MGAEGVILLKSMPLLVLYNIPLLISQYNSGITINAVAKTISNIRISYGYFIRSLGHCISP